MELKNIGRDCLQNQRKCFQTHRKQSQVVRLLQRSGPDAEESKTPEGRLDGWMAVMHHVTLSNNHLYFTDFFTLALKRLNSGLRGAKRMMIILELPANANSQASATGLS